MNTIIRLLGLFLCFASTTAQAQMLTSRNAADSMLNEIHKMPLDTLRLHKLDSLFTENRNSDFSIIFPREMLKDAIKMDEKKFIYLGLFDQELYFQTLQKTDSVEYYHKALKKRLENDKSATANSFLFNSWSVFLSVAVSQDNLELADIEAQRMLKEARQRDCKEGKALAYNSMGEIFTRMSLTQKAIECYNNSLKLNVLDHKQKALVFVHLAELSLNLNHFAEAAAYYEKVIGEYKLHFGSSKVPREYYDTMLYNDIFASYCYLRMDDISKCENWISQADKYYTPQAMIGAYMFYHIFKALYYARMDNYNLCMQHFTMAEKRQDIPVVAYTILENKIRALKKMKRFDEAVPLQQKFISMQDSRREIIDKNNMDAVNENSNYVKAETRKVMLEHFLSLVVIIAVAFVLSIILGIVYQILCVQIKLSKKLDKLDSAKEDARRTDKMKEVFLRNISHDVRVPLTSLIGFSQQLCSDMDMSIEERSMIRNILKANSEKLLNLVNNVLDLSRLESGKMKYVITPFDLVETCRLAEFQLKNNASALCNLDFQCDVTEPIMINHDQQRMLKSIASAINLPSYVHLPQGVEKWNERMTLSVEKTETGKQSWTILIENSPLCAEALVSEEQAILSKILSLYMKEIGADFEVINKSNIKIAGISK